MFLTGTVTLDDNDFDRHILHAGLFLYFQVIPVPLHILRQYVAILERLFASERYLDDRSGVLPSQFFSVHDRVRQIGNALDVAPLRDIYPGVALVVLGQIALLLGSIAVGAAEERFRLLFRKVDGILVRALHVEVALERIHVGVDDEKIIILPLLIEASVPAEIGRASCRERG